MWLGLKSRFNFQFHDVIIHEKAMSDVEFLFFSDGKSQFVVKEFRFVGAIHLKENVRTIFCFSEFDSFVHELFSGAKSLRSW